ncbi:MAG: hypothetical protein MI892_20060 [Desulfobacterales bacterium]|nr:hypothetical protein [Desulfobacterales bacterium]
MSEEERFKEMIEAMIRKHEPLNAELMDFEGMISIKPFHDWAGSAQKVTGREVEFSIDLKSIIPKFKLTQDEIKELFRSTVALYRRGPWVRFTTDRRLTARSIKRPECIAFHDKHGPIPASMRDPKGPSFRAPKNKDNKRGDGSYTERAVPRIMAREECRNFHALYGDFDPSELDYSGKQDRASNGRSSLSDFFK